MKGRRRDEGKMKLTRQGHEKAKHTRTKTLSSLTDRSHLFSRESQINIIDFLSSFCVVD